MKNVISGDTILFEARLSGSDGSALAGAIAIVSATDFSGSAVFSGTATYVTDGTYQRTVEASGWGLGPVTERWRFTNSTGTASAVYANNFRIVGTDIAEAYIAADELVTYYENITDFFDGNEEEQVQDAYHSINSKLEALGCKLPFRVRDDGFFDQPLRDLNAYEAIMRIVSKRQQSFSREGEKTPWFMVYRNEADRIYKGIANKEYNFSRDYSVSEGGISLGTKTYGTSYGQMETSWRGGVGSSFQDSSFERDWIVTIQGTGTAGEIGECPYVWSMNGGISNEGTLKTGLDWQELKNGVYIRFHRGTYVGGTTGLFKVNDQWTFKTFPKTQTVGGKRVARSY